MSVPEGKRNKTTLEVFVKAQQLSTYTIQITSNKKVFPQEFDAVITNKLVDTAIEIYSKAWEANSVRVGENRDRWLLRKTLQEDSIRGCEKMLVLIGIAKGVFHLRDKRIRYWSEKVVEVKSMLRAWYKTDVDRYDKL